MLLLAAHHLVVDAVSWRLILEDLAAAYDAVRKAEPVALGPKTTAFGTWAQRLAAHTEAGGFDGESAYWRDLTPVPLPTDLDGTDLDGANTAGTEQTLTAGLDAETTRALLQDVPQAYRTRINDVLLCALGRVLARWTGRDRVTVALEGHGREELLAGVDLTRTVGWFTAMYPVALDVPGGAGADIGTALKAVKESLRAVPNGGLGYGALRHLRSDAVVRLPGLPGISFNYLGRQDSREPRGALLHAPAGPLTGGMDRACERPFLLDVLGTVADGRLDFTWSYSAGVHRRETVARLAAELAERTAGDRPALRRARRRRPDPVGLPAGVPGPGRGGPAGRHRTRRRRRLPADPDADRHGRPRLGRGRTRPVRRADHLRAGRRRRPRRAGRRLAARGRPHPGAADRRGTARRPGSGAGRATARSRCR